MKSPASYPILSLLALTLFGLLGCSQSDNKESTQKSESQPSGSVAENSNEDSGAETKTKSDGATSGSRTLESATAKASANDEGSKAPETPDQEPEKLAASKLEKINSEFAKSLESLSKDLEKLSTEEEKQAFISEKSPEPKYTQDLFALAQQYPKTDSAFTAGMTIILEYQTSKQFPQTMDLILEHHGGRIQWQKIAEGYLELVPSQQIENWMRKMIETATSVEVKVQMTYLLYRYFDQFPTFASTIEYNPEIKKRFSKERIDYIFNRKKAVRDDMLSDLKAIKAKHPDVKAQNNRLVKDIIDGPIFELEHLQVGSVAPDIEGVDFDGVEFKLSDYRGKVVMLDFWGNWCPPCRAMFPHERDLIEQLVGKPFVLIGVNSDRKLETAIKATNQQNLVWRNFWCGPNGRSGPIAKKWNVSAWPTVYLIDGDGVIRYKEVLGSEIDRGIESLLAEIGHPVEIASKQKEFESRSGLVLNEIKELVLQ